jgi:hypothetical protein
LLPCAMRRQQLTRVPGWSPAFSRKRRRCRKITPAPLPCLEKTGSRSHPACTSMDFATELLTTYPVTPKNEPRLVQRTRSQTASRTRNHSTSARPAPVVRCSASLRGRRKNHQNSNMRLCRELTKENLDGYANILAAVEAASPPHSSSLWQKPDMKRCHGSAAWALGLLSRQICLVF